MCPPRIRAVFGGNGRIVSRWCPSNDAEPFESAEYGVLFGFAVRTTMETIPAGLSWQDHIKAALDMNNPFAEPPRLPCQLEECVRNHEEWSTEASFEHRMSLLRHVRAFVDDPGRKVALREWQLSGPAHFQLLAPNFDPILLVHLARLAGIDTSPLHETFFDGFPHVGGGEVPRWGTLASGCATGFFGRG